MHKHFTVGGLWLLYKPRHRAVCRAFSLALTRVAKMPLIHMSKDIRSLGCGHAGIINHQHSPESSNYHVVPGDICLEGIRTLVPSPWGLRHVGNGSQEGLGIVFHQKRRMTETPRIVSKSLETACRSLPFANGYHDNGTIAHKQWPHRIQG